MVIIETVALTQSDRDMSPAATSPTSATTSVAPPVDILDSFYNCKTPDLGVWCVHT